VVQKTSSNRRLVAFHYFARRVLKQERDVLE
jgi:hypothetical protein